MLKKGNYSLKRIIYSEKEENFSTWIIQRPDLFFKVLCGWLFCALHKTFGQSLLETEMAEEDLMVKVNSCYRTDFDCSAAEELRPDLQLDPEAQVLSVRPDL